jgi:antirestriction protein ArdC
MERNLYADVTARILAELATGAVPWVKPWSAMPGCNHPHNACTGRPYSGCNVVLLWMATQKNNWPTMRYLTFKQAIELGGNVRKGEKGTKVYFVKRLNIKDKDAGPDEKGKVVPMMKEYTVFNVAQCDGLPPKILQPSAKASRNKDMRDGLADEFMAATKADIREGHGQAMYVPSADFIGMPAFASFKNADNFYSTVFHELGHWTGSKARLDRSEGMRGRFGDKAYAAEELVAELCAAFLCAEFNMDGDLRHAGYLSNWMELLKADNRAFFTACSKAQAAADHLRGLALQESAPAELAMAA